MAPHVLLFSSRNHIAKKVVVFLNREAKLNLTKLNLFRAPKKALSRFLETPRRAKNISSRLMNIYILTLPPLLAGDKGLQTPHFCRDIPRSGIAHRPQQRRISAVSAAYRLALVNTLMYGSISVKPPKSR